MAPSVSSQTTSQATPSSSQKSSSTPTHSFTSPSTSSPLAAPKGVLKRKAPKESDMFVANKRPKYTENKSNFGLEYQEEQRKIQDVLPMRPDMLEGIVIPRSFLPKEINPVRGNLCTAGDPSRMYRYAADNRHKARVINHKNINADARKLALAKFPAREREKAQEGVEFKNEVDRAIKWWQSRIEEGERSKREDPEEMRKRKWMHCCWKKLNYAVTFQRGRGDLEHRDMKRYKKAFLDKWEEGGHAFMMMPVWSKDKDRGCLVMFWELNKK